MIMMLMMITNTSMHDLLVVTCTNSHAYVLGTDSFVTVECTLNH